MHMKTSTTRQQNYRRRTRLHHTLISLKIYISAGHGHHTLNELYKRLLEQYLLLDLNKGEQNVQKKRKQT